MLDLLIEHGIDPSNGLAPETLVSLKTVWDQKLAEYKAAKDSSGSTQKLDSFVKPLSEDTDMQERVAKVTSELRAVLIQATDEVPELAFLLVETMGELRKEVISDRDYVMYKNRPEVTPNEAIGEMYSELEGLQKLINNLFTFHKQNPPKGFPTKKLETSGEVVPDIGRLRKPEGEESTVGRYGKAKFLCYKWNGKNVPAGTLLPTVAHDYVSDRSAGFVVTPETIRKMIEESKQKMFEHWAVDFPTGKLEGWLPTDK